MNDTITTPAEFAGKTADEWRAQARRNRQESVDSWERSDTDGFLSQWANDQMAGRYEALATLAENGGFLTLLAMQDIETGEVHRDSWHVSKFHNGAMWLRLNDGSFLNESRARDPRKVAAAYAKKGLREVEVKVPALLNHREMRAYADRDAEWVVDEEATAYTMHQRQVRFDTGRD